MEETTTVLPTSPPTKRPNARHCPYSKPNPILLSGDRRSRKRKSIKVSWQSDDQIHKVHYFENIPDERVNVTRINNVDQQNDANASAGGSSLNANNKISVNAVGSKISSASVDPIRRFKTESHQCIEYFRWPSLVLIDFTPELPSPGWNSLERTAQAERETYVLGAIDLPGQPSTLDEPGQPIKSGPNDSNTSNSIEPSTKEGANHVIIPTESADGQITDYSNMYSSGLMFPCESYPPIMDYARLSDSLLYNFANPFESNVAWLSWTDRR